MNNTEQLALENFDRIAKTNPWAERLAKIKSHELLRMQARKTRVLIAGPRERGQG